MKTTVAVIGGGKFGTVLADLASQNTQLVRMWVREQVRARELNATRATAAYFPELQLNERVRAVAELPRLFETPVDVVIWALPSEVCRSVAREVAPLLSGRELVIHATKGLERGTLKRISQVLVEELPSPRVGVISGPNLAVEIAAHQPAATVVASRFREVQEAGVAVFEQPRFRVQTTTDVVGVEWAGVLKNVLALASGWAAGRGLGWNTRAWLISQGLGEMLKFAEELGAESGTFLGLAGVGDVLATCSSELSRNFRVGMRLAQGATAATLEQEATETAEGLSTTLSVGEFARMRGLKLPLLSALENCLRTGDATKLEQFLGL